MRVLLDTHIFCWWYYQPERLSRKAFRIIKDADEVYISSASVWEIAIKARLGKIKADARELVAQIERNDFQELPVLSKHALIVADLPLHHADPFDRLLIAQATSEPLRLLTADEKLRPYGALIISV